MTTTSIAKGYLYPGFVLVHWVPEQRLEEAIELRVDGAALEKPYLGIEFAGQIAYLIGTRLNHSEVQPPQRIGVFNSDGAILADTTLDTAERIQPAFINNLPLATRLRLRQAFLAGLWEFFPQLPIETFHLLAEDLAETEVTFLRGPENLAYFHLESIDNGGNNEIRAIGGGFQPSPKEPLLPLEVRIFENAAGLHGIIEACPKSTHGIFHLRFPDGQYLTFAPNEASMAYHEPHAPSWLAAIHDAQEQASEQLNRFVHGALQSRPQGWLDGIQDGWLRGWAERQDDPTAILELSCLMDGSTEIGPVRADLPYAIDSGAKRSSGFALRIPPEYLNGSAHSLQLIDRERGIEISSSPYLLGAGTFDGEFELTSEGFLEGWIKERHHLDCLGDESINVRIDGTVDPTLRPAALKKGKESRILFKIALPDRVFDTQTHRIEVLIHSKRAAGGTFCLSRALTVEASYRGEIEKMHPADISGWIVNTIAPERPVPLEVRINGHLLCQGPSCLPRSITGEPVGIGFLFRPEAFFESGRGNYKVGLYLAGTDIEPLGEGKIFTPLETALHGLTYANQLLKRTSIGASDPKGISEGLEFSDDPYFWVREAVLVPIIEALRSHGTLDTQFSLKLSSLHQAPESLPIDDLLSVLIPVYKGKETTLRCIQSVLNAACLTPFELTVINDGSPEPDLVEEIRALSSLHGFTFIDQPRNLGFTATVNRHFRESNRKDVILLNSDTLVCNGWIDRLRASAYSASNIGTVTPLSNNATLVSFPRSFEENELPEGASLEQVDRLCAKVNAGDVVDLPTGVGFCFYIKRALLDEIGLFDEKRWGKGYGEENDFCFRASHKGWRNVAACDVFVFHEGSVSFGKGRVEIMRQNQAKLDALYPDYQNLIQRFRLQDPLKSARSRLALALLSSRSSRYLLYIAHTWGGGTERALRDLEGILRNEGQSVLVLRAISADRWILESLNDGLSVTYEGRNLLEKVVPDLEALGVWHVHYHQVLGFGPEIWSLPERLDVAFDVTIHDFTTICPRVTLMNGPASYCGDEQYRLDSCERCVRINGLENAMEKPFQRAGGSVALWREGNITRLEKARKIFIPSEAAALIFRGHAAHLPIVVKAHPAPTDHVRMSSESLMPFSPMSDRVSVLIMGAIGDVKGFHRLRECVHDAALRGLPLFFDLLGFTQDDEAFKDYENIRIQGAYDPDEAIERILESGATLALFLSPAPETWSYTLSETLEAGLFPVGLDIGAIGQRIRESGTGHLLPLEATASAINDALYALSKDPSCQRLQPRPSHALNRDILKSYYEL